MGRWDYAEVFRAIDALGYDGWVGAEYRPPRRYPTRASAGGPR